MSAGLDDAPKRNLPLQLPITASDIARLLSLDLCNFRLPSGRAPLCRFRITRQLTAPDQTILFDEVFEVPSSNDTIDLHLGFTPTAGFPRGVLLASDAQIELRLLFVSGCESIEANFEIENLLPEVAPRERCWFVLPRNDKSPDVEQCLLVVQSVGRHSDTPPLSHFPLARIDVAFTTQPRE